MSPLQRKGLLLAALHVAVVASLGARLLVDRATYPRVWARTVPVDPDLPIRGRYVRLRIEAARAPGLVLPRPAPIVNPDGTAFTPAPQPVPITLAVEDDRLVAMPAPVSARLRARPGRDSRTVELVQPLAYFIPEHADDPSRRAAGEELWVEVTVPPRGPPRPIRLGVRKAGAITER